MGNKNVKSSRVVRINLRMMRRYNQEYLWNKWDISGNGKIFGPFFFQIQSVCVHSPCPWCKPFQCLPLPPLPNNLAKNHRASHISRDYLRYRSGHSVRFPNLCRKISKRSFRIQNLKEQSLWPSELLSTGSKPLQKKRLPYWQRFGSFPAIVLYFNTSGQNWKTYRLM